MSLDKPVNAKDLEALEREISHRKYCFLVSIRTICKIVLTNGNDEYLAIPDILETAKSNWIQIHTLRRALAIVRGNHC